MKNKNLFLIGVTVALLLITVIGATFAYFISYNPTNIHNVTATANLASSNSVFAATGSSLTLNVEAVNMQQKDSGTIAAENNGTINITYLAGTNEALECTYDIFYKWKDDTDEYSKDWKVSTDDLMNEEFDFEIKYDNEVMFPQTRFKNSDDKTPTKLFSDYITNASETVLTEKVYDIDAKFYNRGYDQTKHAGKSYKIEFYVDNVECGPAGAEPVYAYFYESPDANNLELVLRNTKNGDEENLTGLSNNDNFNAKVTLLGLDSNNTQIESLEGDGRVLNKYYGDISRGFINFYFAPGYNSSFAGKVKSINIQTEIHPISTAYWFNYLNNVTEIKGLENLNTSRVKDMTNMFSHMDSIINLNLSHFDTSLVKNMYGMFYSTYNLRNLDVSNFDTRKVENMASMIGPSYYLENIDVSSWNTSNVTNMYRLFNSLYNVTEIDVSSFDTSNVKDMTAMFTLSNVSTFNLQSFTTTENTKVDYLFGWHSNSYNVTATRGKWNATTIFDNANFTLVD